MKFRARAGSEVLSGPSRGLGAHSPGKGLSTAIRWDTALSLCGSAVPAVTLWLFGY